jgi:hypothetical protein
MRSIDFISKTVFEFARDQWQTMLETPWNAE